MRSMICDIYILWILGFAAGLNKQPNLAVIIIASLRWRG